MKNKSNKVWTKLFFTCDALNDGKCEEGGCWTREEFDVGNGDKCCVSCRLRGICRSGNCCKEWVAWREKNGKIKRNLE